MNKKMRIRELTKLLFAMFAAAICMVLVCTDAFAAVKKGTYDVDNGNLPFTEEELYEQLFDINNKLVIKLDVTKAELAKLQADYSRYSNMGSKSPIYRKADLYITICRSTDEYTYVLKEVGIRMKGNTSRTSFYDSGRGIYNLVHFKLDFQETFDDEAYYTTDAHVWGDDKEGKALRKARKNRTFASLEKLEMKWNRCLDSTLIREYYAYETFRAAGVPAPHVNIASTDISSTHLGVYNIYEPVDKIFIEKNFSEEQAGGDLYKCGWVGSSAPDMRNTDLIGVEDEDACKFYNYDLKTNKKKSENKELKALIEALQNNDLNKADISGLVDMDEYLKFMAVSYFTGNPDDFRNNYNNYYIYFLKDSGKAVFIPYDLDRVYGLSNGWDPNGDAMMGTDPFSSKAYGAGDTQRNPLIKKTVCDGGLYIKEFAAALKKVAAGSYLTTGKFNGIFEIVKKNYSSDVTPSKDFDNAKKSVFVINNTSAMNGNRTWAAYLNGIKASYERETADVDSRMAEPYYVKGDFNNWAADSAYRMSYNASTGTYTYKMNARSQIKFKLCDSKDNWKGMEVMYYFSPALKITEVGEHRNIIAPKGTYNICYNPAKDRMWITIYKTDPVITAPARVTKYYGDAAFSLNAKTGSGGKLTYVAVNEKVCTVSADGKVTLKGAYGKTTIYVKTAATTFYNAASKKVEIVVNPAKEKLTSVTSPAKGKLNLIWNKDTKVTGYEVYYTGMDSSFKTYFKKVVRGNANNRLNLTGLSSGRTYYVRVRSFVTYGTNTYYGAYSNIIKITVK